MHGGTGCGEDIGEEGARVGETPTMVGLLVVTGSANEYSTALRGVL